MASNILLNKIFGTIKFYKKYLSLSKNIKYIISNNKKYLVYLLYNNCIRRYFNIIRILLLHYTFPQTIIDENLIVACNNRSLKIARLLLIKGANPQYKNNNSLVKASCHGMIKIVRLLISYGADPLSNDNEPLISAY